MSFVYLCSPYTPTRAGDTVESRAHDAAKAAAKLMAAGHVVFSPIVHSHYVAEFLPADKRLDHHFWMHQDLPILRRAREVFVLRLPGWERSRGIAREISEAAIHNIPVRFLDAE